MITATTLATVIMICVGVGVVWDLFDPDAVKVKFNSPLRAAYAVCYVIALLTMCLVVVL